MITFRRGRAEMWKRKLDVAEASGSESGKNKKQSEAEMAKIFSFQLPLPLFWKFSFCKNSIKFGAH